MQNKFLSRYWLSALFLILFLCSINNAFAAICEIDYVIDAQWNNGFTGRVRIHNTTAQTVNGWRVDWTMPDHQQIQHLWNGVYTQDADAVTVNHAHYNATIAAGGTVEFGFNGSHQGTNAIPTDFRLNGIFCNESPGSNRISVSFVEPLNHAIVNPSFTVKMAASGVTVEPAGEVHDGAGHMHILIDTDFIPAGQPIPSTPQHLHFGGGQLQTTLQLAPGPHTLRLQLADGHHIAFEGEQYRDEITVMVEQPGPCQIDYFIVSQWPSGFTGRVKVSNLGSRDIEGWQVGWTMPDGQQINHLWNGAYTQNGADVTVDHVHYNTVIAAGASREFGFNSSHNGINTIPTDLHLNGVFCNAQPEPEPISVHFVEPANGATVSSQVDVKMAASGVTVEPAGEVHDGAGHMHILIDTDFIPAGQPIPSTPQHLHFGGGQLSTTLHLEPGTHTLRLQLADGHHIALEGEQYRDEITVTVEPPEPEPEPILVSFVEPLNHAIVNPSFTVKMAASGVTVEPAGEVHDGAGHMHILIDTDFIPAGQPIPSTPQHLHFGGGQLQTTLQLSPGPHTLRLQLADGHHIAFEGEQYRDEIVITVEGSEGPEGPEGPGGGDPAPPTGAELYVSKGCSSCHGDRGQGVGSFPALTRDYPDRNALIQKIDSSMPLGNPAACQGDCAALIADYILANFANSTPPTPLACSNEEIPSPQLLRLLTRREYDNTTRDLLGVTTALSANLPVESRVLGYDNNAAVNVVTARHIDAYLAAAQDLATRALASNRANLLPCDPEADANACAQQFVEDLGLRAYRRPLSQGERDRLQGLFATAANFDAGMQLAIRAMLISPHFLYRSEIGELMQNGYYQLTPYEVASSLSYLFWGSLPDQTLFEAAASGQLQTPEQLTAQARRLLADPRAREQIGVFMAQWLGADPLTAGEKDPLAYPNYSRAVQEAGDRELVDFINHVIFTGHGDFYELFQANYVFANRALAEFYGLSGVTDDQLQLTPVNNGSRGGLLSLASVLAAHAHADDASPVKRGVFVRNRLLCHELPPPPPTVDNTPPALDPTLTTRERFAAHSSSEACQVCHRYIDGVGFGFEAYNGAGEYRLSENGKLVDDSGHVLGLDTFDATNLQAELPNNNFSGLRELSDLLVTSESAPRCLTTQYFRYARGYQETTADRCTVDNLHQQFTVSGYDLSALLTSIVNSPSFILRRDARQEVQ